MSAESHGSYKSYITGFAFSVILTIIPFTVVLGEFDISLVWALTAIFATGAIQMLVHVYYFLHVDFKQEEGWVAMSLIFTAGLLIIILVGSIWVMTHLHENMMPGHQQIEQVLGSQ